jgi:endonuclease/exonuclease/phosphatase family metal-dependent hydrolase
MTETEHKLRVLTWNIHRGVGIDFCHDIHRIGDVIGQIDADIVAIQEVDLRTKSDQSIDLL